MLKFFARCLAVLPLVAAPAQSRANSPASPTQTQPPPTAPLSLSALDREAIGRVAFAEAGNQAEEGLAGVIYTILNRLRAGRWGGTAQAVVDAPGQFEPVMNAGGKWQNLPALSPGQEVEANTILDLIEQHRLPDPTHGALYFQNPAIVAQRAANGTVSPSLVNFGGETPIAVIRDHSFYATFAGSGVPQSLVPMQAQKPHLFIDGKLTSDLAEGQGNSPGLFVPVDAAPKTAQDDQTTGLFVAVTTPQATPEPGFMAPSPGATGN
ncbi:MAG: cell wall hydrolase [Betaproteobacteria bacterium]|nr:cell wall hydrolase [Betaproteobacteria bacterium]